MTDQGATASIAVVFKVLLGEWQEISVTVNLFPKFLNEQNKQKEIHVWRETLGLGSEGESKCST